MTMKNLKCMTGFVVMCIIAVMMAGVALASVTGQEQNNGNGNVVETGANGSNNETERAGREIASFNNYGVSGMYTALGEYEVAYGSNIADVTNKLPNTLTATLTSGEEVEVPVTWVCVNDNLGGTAYVPEHENAAAVYTFEAKLGEGYTLANNLPGDYVMPFTTVRYTENAQTLNSNMENGENTLTNDTNTAGNVRGMSAWSWIIWIIVIVAVVLVLWWLFAGSKGNGRNDE